MLPPSAEGSVPDALDEAALARWVAEHPERREVRMTVAVLRDGARESALRLREKDSRRRSSPVRTWSRTSRTRWPPPSRADVTS